MNMDLELGLNPDRDREILFNLHGKELFAISIVNKYLNNLCDTVFWQQKFIRAYGVNIMQIDYKKVYNELYIREYPYQQFIWAAKRGYEALVTKIMERQNRFVLLDESLAFIEAARRGHLSVVKLLFECAINTNYQERALILAAKRGRVRVVEFLLGKGVSVKAGRSEALIDAARRGHVDVVKLLFERGATIKQIPAAEFVGICSRGHLEMVKLLLLLFDLNDHIFMYARFGLFDAAYKGRIEVVEFLLNKGVHFAYKELDSALVWAMKCGWSKLVGLLLDHGCDLKRLNEKVIRYIVTKGHNNVLMVILQYAGHWMVPALKIAKECGRVKTVDLIMTYNRKFK